MSRLRQVGRLLILALAAVQIACSTSTPNQGSPENDDVRSGEGVFIVQDEALSASHPKRESGHAYPPPSEREEGWMSLDAPEQIVPGAQALAPPGNANESYDQIVPNAFKLTAKDRLSTFSADVNTASYSNVRRILQQDRLPPPDAVRIAEMINYFDYDYPEPVGSDPVAIGLELAPCPWQPDHKLLRIALQARKIEPSELPARNFVFLIDISGSMGRPNKLPLVQSALSLLVKQLDHNDTVSIVTYAGSTQLHLAPIRADQQARILDRINVLHAGGSTNGSGGLKLAYDQADANFNPNAINRVILCTDGDFNIGPSSDVEMVKLIEAKRKTGVHLTVLGFGMGNLKDSKLEKLARHGNGHYAYLDDELEARKVFVEQGGALVTVAKDVKLQVEFNPKHVKEYRQIGYENRRLKNEDFLDPTVDAGEMGSGHAVTALYEIVPVDEQSDTTTSDWNDWLLVRMISKSLDDVQAQPFEVVMARDGEVEQPSEDFRFAAAVAEFGMLLRNSEHQGQASYEHASKAASGAIGADPHGHRAEFVRLVELARGLRPKD